MELTVIKYTNFFNASYAKRQATNTRLCKLIETNIYEKTSPKEIVNND